jgi:hypothetical protein
MTEPGAAGIMTDEQPVGRGSGPVHHRVGSAVCAVVLGGLGDRGPRKVRW